MKNLLAVLGPVAFVVGQHVPEKYRLTRLGLLGLGGAVTAAVAWSAYRKAMEDSWA